MIGITELPQLFSEEDCEVFLKQMEVFAGRESYITRNDVLADYWRDKIFDRLPKIMRCEDGWYEVLNITSQITIGHSTKPIKRHVDEKFSGDDFAKIVVYLNDSSGTCFKIGEEDYCIGGGKGNAILFDIRYPHWGDAMETDQLKIVGGFRVTGRKIFNGGRSLKRV